MDAIRIVKINNVNLIHVNTVEQFEMFQEIDLYGEPQGEDYDDGREESDSDD